MNGNCGGFTPEVFEITQSIPKLEIKYDFSFPPEKMNKLKQSHLLVCAGTGVKSWAFPPVLTSPFPGVWCECM